MMIHEAEISGDHVALPILKNPQSVDARAQTVKAIDERIFADDKPRLYS